MINEKRIFKNKKGDTHPLSKRSSNFDCLLEL